MQALTPSRVFDMTLPAMPLEGGGVVEPLRLRGWWWGPASDMPALAARTRLLNQNRIGRESLQIVRRGRGEEGPSPVHSGPPLDPTIPTVLVVHALTGDMRSGGSGGWWEPAVGPGRALDPTRVRLVCFNNLGSCYGTSGPADADFPTQVDRRLPAVVTPWDQARAILHGLDALGIGRVHLATGGSLGGMIVLCLAALAPERFERIAPIATCEASSAWIIGWNHVARQALLADPGYPEDPRRGLEIARELAMLTYRAEPGLHLRQGRRLASADQRWNPLVAYKVETYLEHQGRKLRERFDARAYVVQLGAMDHHDLARPPTVHLRPGEPEPEGDPSLSWGVRRIRAQTLAVRIDTDALFLPEQSLRLTEHLRAAGRVALDAAITSRHGHDAFLIEWDQLAPLLTRALALPPGA
jgi:homoserine O-acetyltransferase